ncbi:MAG: sulfurtransferase TusA family protein [Clostridia bacterium]|jgi:tRNA 2-thiouridine synthesizing protein A|nr:sulfurtransferase TusA family protein [Clostridia bacterium]
MVEVDVRGLTCPIPVVRTQQAITENPGQEIVTLCDSSVAKENVTRLAEKKGYTVTETKEGPDFKLVLKP